MVLRKVVHSNTCDISGFSDFDCRDKNYDTLYPLLQQELDVLCRFPKHGDYPSKTIHCSCKDGMGITYLVYNDDNAVGYFTLATGSISFNDRAFGKEYIELIPKELTIWGTYSFPAMRISQLAVDRKYHQKPLVDESGRELKVSEYIMEKIFDEVQMMSRSAGVRYIIVNALAVPKTVGYYAKWGFVPQPRDEALFNCLMSQKLSDNHDHDAVAMYIDLNRDMPSKSE